MSCGHIIYQELGVRMSSVHIKHQELGIWMSRGQIKHQELRIRMSCGQVKHQELGIRSLKFAISLAITPVCHPGYKSFMYWHLSGIQEISPLSSKS